MRIQGAIALTLAGLLFATPADARILTVVAWQAQVYRVTHRDAHGNFDGDANSAFLLNDYESAASAMSTGYSLAAQKNRQAQLAGKPLFCPPTKQPELNSGEVYSYFQTLPLDYRQKTAMVDAMLGFAIQKFPCPATAR